MLRYLSITNPFWNLFPTTPWAGSRSTQRRKSFRRANSIDSLECRLLPAIPAPVITTPAEAPPSQNPTPVNVTGTHRVTFEWTAVAQAVSYDVWVKSWDYLPAQQFHRATVTGTTYTPEVDFGVGSYTVWLRSLGTQTNSVWTQGRNFTVVARSTITPMAAIQNTARPTLSWSPVLGATKYTVELIDRSNSDNPSYNTFTTTSYTYDFDLPLARYRIWVTVMHYTNFTIWSMPVDFQIAPAPTITQGLNSTFNRTPTFGWNAVTGATGYEFQLKNRNTGAMVLARTVTGTSVTPDSSLPDGPYRWFVRAKTAQNLYSNWTAATDIYVGGRTDVLTPTGTTDDTTPAFSWRPVEGAARYELWVTRLDVPAVVIKKNDNTETNFSPEIALAAGNYRVWVRAVSTTNEFGPWSLPVNFTVTVIDSREPDGLSRSLPVVLLPELRESEFLGLAGESAPYAEHYRSSTGDSVADGENPAMDIRNVRATESTPPSSDKCDSDFRTIDDVILEWALADGHESGWQ